MSTYKTYQHKRFPSADWVKGKNSDGTGSEIKDQHVIYKYCLVDMSDIDLGDMDEAVGITYGAAATFDHCIIRGAGKLFLCGSGDEEYREDEYGRTVSLDHCILEDFGRRGPEVQCGMNCIITNCLIQNWGTPDRFSVRNFGAWAHDEGRIRVINTVFKNSIVPPFHQRVADLIAHVGQAVNDNGIKALFDKKSYIPGVRRALTKSDTGTVEAWKCYSISSKYDLLIEGNESPMTSDEAMELMNGLEAMRDYLMSSLVE